METVQESHSTINLSLDVADFGTGFDFWILSRIIVDGIHLLYTLTGGQLVGMHSSYLCSFGSSRVVSRLLVCQWLKEFSKSGNLWTSSSCF